MGVPHLISRSKLNEAQAMVQAGGGGVREGVAMLLTAMDDYRNSEGSDGINGSQVLAAAMRRLTEDPYLTLGLEPQCDEASIKKAYRKLALKYHPDKNKATPTLFQAVQGAHDVLIEPDKRAEYDVKRKRQQDALSRLRKHPKAAGPPTDTGTGSGATKTGGSSAAPTSTGGTKARSSAQTGGSTAGVPTSGAGSGRTKTPHVAGGQAAPSDSGGGGVGSAATGDEKVRQFNKRFYEEFRREAQKSDKSKGSRRAAGAVPEGSTHQPPPRPKMRSTNRTDSTVTLEWHCGGLPVTTAYELQWRQRGRTVSDWVTSPTLVVGNSCRKKNLEACTCYEFRVRAASAWGWSGHCDPVVVVTLPSSTGGGDASGAGGTAGDRSAATPRQKVTGFQSDGISGSAASADRARAQVEEARRRRSQTHRGSQHASGSSQFRSSSITGNDGDDRGQEDGRASRSRSPPSTRASGETGGRTSSDLPPGASGPTGLEKTNSWYWRRMSRAAACEERDSTDDGMGKEKAQRRRTMHEKGTPSERAWACVVCKRQNEPASNSCWVCYTARSYQPVNLDRIRTDNDTVGEQGARSPSNSDRRGSLGSRPGVRVASSEETKASRKTYSKQGERHAKEKTKQDVDEAERTAVSGSGQGAPMPHKAPSIRVYSVPNQRADNGDGADGIRVSGSAAAPVSAAAGAEGGGATATSGATIRGGGVEERGKSDPADVWEFTEGDLDNNAAAKYDSDDDWSYASGIGGIDTRSDPGDPARYRRRSSAAAGSGDSSKRRQGSRAGGVDVAREAADTGPPKRYLNGRITKLHNVRAEPILESTVVGYLIATKEVEVVAEVGNWYKVRWHKRAKEKDKGKDKDKEQQSTPLSAKDDGDERKTHATPADLSPADPSPAASSSDAAAAAGDAKDAVREKSDDNRQEGGGDEQEEPECADDSSMEGGAGKGCGWCLTRDSKHKYIVTIGAEEARSDAKKRPSSATSRRKRSTAGRRRSSVTGIHSHVGVDGIGGEETDNGELDEDGDAECWNELKDEDGSVYYFNTASGVSQWEPPLWLDEIDPITGAIYYVNSYSGEPQWERPEHFVPITRENPYASTPEQEFIKSVLSPKRSKGAKSFHEAMHTANKSAKESARHLNTVSEGSSTNNDEGVTKP